MTIKFHIRFRHNIRAHIKWFEYLESDRHFKNIKKNYETKANTRELQRLVREIVEQEIYSKNTTEGTGRIKESVESISNGNQQTAAVTAFFDPTVSPAKGPVDQGDINSMSYAAFFDEPAWNSFLPPNDDAYSPVKYRPFREPLTQAGQHFAKEQAIRAIVKATLIERPRQQKETK